MRSGFDAAYPPAIDDVRTYDVMCFYIGGDTPHVWTDGEIASFPNRYRLPIFTRDSGGDPVQDATAAVSWALRHSQPKGTLIALDFETRVDSGYLSGFDGYVTRQGYKTLVYGSLSAVLLNPEPSGGYWTADWDGNPSLQPSTATATQYLNATQTYDSSVFADSAPLWDTKPLVPPPGPGPAPTPVPAPRRNKGASMNDCLVYVAPATSGQPTSIYWFTQGRYIHLDSVLDVEAVIAAFPSLPVVHVSNVTGTNIATS